MRSHTNTHTHACTHCHAKDGVDYEGAVGGIITSQQLPYSEVNWEFKAGTSVVTDVTGCVWALQFYAEVGVGGSVGAPQFYTDVDTEMSDYKFYTKVATGMFAAKKQHCD